MTTYKPGQIILVRFPFSEITRTKKRPALVLWQSDFRKFTLCTIAMITSSTGLEAHPLDVMLADLQAAGLPHASTVRLAKVATVDGEVIEKVLGVLSAADSRHIKAKLSTIMKHWL